MGMSQFTLLSAHRALPCDGTLTTTSSNGSPTRPRTRKSAKLEQTLRQYRLPLHESVPLFASLLSLPLPDHRYPPLTLAPQRQRQKTLETLVTMLLEHAEQRPVLFVVEDLHWTDPSTLALLGPVDRSHANRRSLDGTDVPTDVSAHPGVTGPISLR